LKRSIITNIIIVLFACWFFLSGARPPKEAETDFQLNAFAQLPVKFDGRKKPIDTFARNLLTVLSDKQSLRIDGEKLSATEWLLDAVSRRPEAADYPVFRIENLDVLSSIGLQERKGFRYAYRELLPSLVKIEVAASAAYAKEESQRDLYDKQIAKLANKVYLYQNVLTAFEDSSAIPPAQRAVARQRYRQFESLSLPFVIPPDLATPHWRPLMVSLLADSPADSPATLWSAMLSSYRESDAARFNASLADYRTGLEPDGKLVFEAFYNRLDSFMKSAELYLLVFVLSLFGWLFRKDGLVAAACTLMVCAFVPHTFAIIARCFLSGYPPVTNLYSSAIFIGWAAVAVGIGFELGLRKKAAGMGNLVGSIAGFATLLVAHFLAGDGDTMEQMRAVLDSRFWLTTHVITISLGYMAAFVAGIIGLFYIVAGLFTRRLDAETSENMDRMMYATICFALLLSFVGTVLGGLWADDSWGRFWGWDPKENGALLIVMWNAIMLHARYGKMVARRGFAVMAVGGNIVTAWSWFGVNQLGVGLHSYGFTQSATFWLTLFILTQLAVVLLGLVPTRRWKSSRL